MRVIATGRGLVGALGYMRSGAVGCYIDTVRQAGLGR
jgi:hypothetical protein